MSELINIANEKQLYAACFVSNEEPYPLCKGIGKEKCHHCCLYEDYEKYHSPYND